MIPFTAAAVRRKVSSRSFAQGAECRGAGRVRDIRSGPAGIVWASVADHGNPGRVHTVAIGPGTDGHGGNGEKNGQESFHGECTCGQGPDCRHVAAVLLSVLPVPKRDSDEWNGSAARRGRRAGGPSSGAAAPGPKETRGVVPRTKAGETVRRSARPVPRLTLFGATPPASLHRAMQAEIEMRLAGISGDLHLYRPGFRSSPFPYPCVRLDFVYPGAPEPIRAHTLRDGNRYRGTLPAIRILHDDHVEVIERDRDLEAGCLERLDALVIDHCGGELARAARFCVREFDEGGRIDHLLPMPADPKAGGFAPAFDFHSRTVPALRSAGWEVVAEESWPVRILDGPAEFSTALEPSGDDWFSLSLRLTVDGRSVDLVPLMIDFIGSLSRETIGALEGSADPAESVRALLAGRAFHPRFPDGACAAVSGDRLAPFVAAFLEAHGLTGFHLAEAGRATALAGALEGCGAPWSAGGELRELGERLRKLADPAAIGPPAGLAGTLRPYQLQGYGWLRALAGTGFGGVLADDMGLGKTVQALALLAHEHLERKTDRPSLLVVPTSLLGNWRREAARFVPDLRLLVLHGAGRAADFAAIPEHHLAVTTYALVHRDHAELFRHEYGFAILDEAQNVKNPAAGIAKRIRGIRARQRLALTGTPMENNLGELWALFDWLIPGLLGDRRSFDRDYRTPIEQEGNPERRRLLATRLKPFLLRRTKEEVAAELPPKTVIDEVLPLGPDQAALYEGIRVAMDERVRRAVAEKGIAGSRITILDALLKLRQACCDPALVKLDAARKVHQSAKRDRLFQLLEELLDEGRQVLVFSQFVTMLRLIGDGVSRRGWSYSMLHGGTEAQDRDEQVRRFQAGEARVFLVSLKAGGTGLNLTAADTVILYDPWWNPAVERQAMDRTHRIGRERPVFVHRLIAEGTVETAIRELQDRKQALADALFEGTGDGPLALTEDDLGALFRGADARAQDAGTASDGEI